MAPAPDTSSNPPGDPFSRPSGSSCAGDSSTSLKWGSNGELSPVDLQRVLERLTDPALTRCPLDTAD